MNASLAALGDAITTIAIVAGGVQERAPRHASFDIQRDNYENQECDDDPDPYGGVTRGHESDRGCEP